MVQDTHKDAHRFPKAIGKKLGTFLGRAEHAAPSQSGRIGYIDIARAMTISLVVLGHVMKSGTYFELIYTFHMPLFFFISGMFLQTRSEGFSFARLKSVAKKRAAAYYAPYIIWALFYSKLKLKNFLMILYGTQEMMMQTKSLSYLWFLPALFMASMLAEIVMSIGRQNKKAVLLQAALLYAIGFCLPHLQPYGYPLGLDASLVGAGFMIMGYLIRPILDQIRGRCHAAQVFIGTLLLLAVFVLFNKFCLSHEIEILYKMYKGLHIHVSVFLFNAFVGILMMMGASIFLDLIFPNERLLKYIGQNTFGILVLHRGPVNYGRNWASQNGYSYKSLPLALVIAVISLAITLLVTTIIARICPELVGRRKKPSHSAERT